MPKTTKRVPKPTRKHKRALKTTKCKLRNSFYFIYACAQCQKCLNNYQRCIENTQTCMKVAKHVLKTQNQGCALSKLEQAVVNVHNQNFELFVFATRGVFYLLKKIVCWRFFLSSTNIISPTNENTY